MPFRTVTLDALKIVDREAFAGVGLYAGLERTLRQAGHRFRIPSRGTRASWDRVAFLNLTFWGAEQQTDYLCDGQVPADVVAHAAWHHLAARELARETAGAPSTALALLFGESIASAFDLYLVGRLLLQAPRCTFLTTQLPIMAEVAAAAGLGARAFAALLRAVAADPEAAFEDLRRLLLDTAGALLACADADAAERVLERRAHHRFHPLLHHYQLSNWLLYARAYGAAAPRADAAVRRLDATLRRSAGSLAWLAARWLGGAGPSQGPGGTGPSQGPDEIDGGRSGRRAQARYRDSSRSKTQASNPTPTTEATITTRSSLRRSLRA